MSEAGRTTNPINPSLSVEAWRAWLALIVLFLTGLIVFAVGYFWMGTLPAQPIPTAKLMSGTLSEIVQWIGLTAMATAAVLGISEIKWFRDYLEHRLARAIESERGNFVEALNEEVKKEVRNDFLERSRDLAWLRRNLSQKDILAVRDAVIGASIATLDENRYAILREHIYPIFDRPWRENHTIALTHSEVDGKFLVTTDVSWTYVNKTSDVITVPQTLRLILPSVSGISADEFLKQSRFEVDGTPIAVPWKSKEAPEGRLQFEAKFDCNVKPGGSVASTIVSILNRLPIPPSFSDSRY